MCKSIINPFRRAEDESPDVDRYSEQSLSPLEFHRSLPGYAPTPLIALPDLARHLGLGQILVKDEAHRFGLKAFKVLGASYAMFRWLGGQSQAPAGSGPCPKQGRRFEDWTHTANGQPVCTATDGNHGRAVAWMARLTGRKAYIYLPRETVPARIDSIRSEGAEVTIVDGTYDDAVRRARTDADQNGWQVISDTSWPGYTEVPAWIQQGYATMFEEIDGQLGGLSEGGPDAVFIQGGVGALAAAAASHFSGRSDQSVKLICVEPLSAACLMESAASREGQPRACQGKLDSEMAGLNCGHPSIVAWPFIRNRFDVFLAISDRYAEQAMRAYYYPLGRDPRIISGESGAAGLGALLAYVRSDACTQVRADFPLGSESRVLLLNTEGDTDPVNFRRVIEADLQPGQ